METGLVITVQIGTAVIGIQIRLRIIACIEIQIPGSACKFYFQPDCIFRNLKRVNFFLTGRKDNLDGYTVYQRCSRIYRRGEWSNGRNRKDCREKKQKYFSIA